PKTTRGYKNNNNINFLGILWKTIARLFLILNEVFLRIGEYTLLNKKSTVHGNRINGANTKINFVPNEIPPASADRNKYLALFSVKASQKKYKEMVKNAAMGGSLTLK